MKNKNTRRGFTLIELLVVVLIIGILAAVAVPQYQKAVYKSRTAEAVTMLTAIVNAQEVYFLANGQYTTNISDLDVDIPADLIYTTGTTPENSYQYHCLSSYCAAVNNSTASLPFFEFHMQHAGAKDDGRWLCSLGSGTSKNSMAKSICQSMGKLDDIYDDTSWGVGKYFRIN